MFCNFACNISNSANIEIAVFSREPQFTAEMLSDAVSIQKANSALRVSFMQTLDKCICDGRLSRTRQTRKKDGDAL